MTPDHTESLPANDIAIDGDTAWWVCKGDVQRIGGRDEILWDLDRPCDTCDGQGTYYPMQRGWGRARQHACPACHGTGRHTFEIEVEVFYDALENAWVGGQRQPHLDHVGSESSRVTATTLTVSVVLNRVLRIVDGFTADTPRPFVYLMDGAAPMLVTDDGYMADPNPLPPAARPGMFAIQLRIVRKVR